MDNNKIIQFPKAIVDALENVKKKAEEKLEPRLSDALIALARTLKFSGNDPIVQNGEFHEFIMQFKIDGETVNFYRSQLIKAEITPVNNTKN